jgi:hypothetical protein
MATAIWLVFSALFLLLVFGLLGMIWPALWALFLLLLLGFVHLMFPTR